MNKILNANSLEEYTQKGCELIQQISPSHLALAGGTSPNPIYSQFHTLNLDWQNLHLWWSDERFVAHDHPDSNYQQVQQYITHWPISQHNIHPVPIAASPQVSAQSYALEIEQNVGAAPVFDLIMLGIGPDGHTASLFPNTPEGENKVTDFVIPVLNSPKPPPQRITFTFNLINQAKNVLVTVKGQDRVQMIEQWLNGKPVELPFTHINPPNGNVHWLLLEGQ